MLWMVEFIFISFLTISQLQKLYANNPLEMDIIFWVFKTEWNKKNLKLFKY